MSDKKLESVQVNEKQKMFLLDYAAISRLVVNDLNNSLSTSSTFFQKYSKENIRRFLENPQRNEKQLRDISKYLYNASMHYKRLINFFAGLLTLDYVVEPYGINYEKVDKTKLLTNYQKTLDVLDVMNLKHEFKKILLTAFKEDIFYGYEHTTKESYFIQKLDPDFCQVSSIEDGVYNFSFNFTYFDKYKDKLEQYPNEFKKKYNIYKNDTKNKWIELDADKTICIKANEDFEYPLPYFVAILENLIDIDDYKALKKSKEELQNYKILVEKIPIRTNSEDINDFLIDLDTAAQFHNKSANALPDQVGIILSPFEIDSIDFNTNRVDSDNVAQAERDLWNATGTSQALFNSDKSTSVTLAKSIVTDEQIAFGVLRQLERWLNRKLKTTIKGAYKFKVRMLDITRYNQGEYFDRMLKAAERGLPTKIEACASLGMSPSAVNNMTFLENEVLGLQNVFIPLSSTHTQSDKDGAGRPSSNEDDLGEEGARTKEEGKNEGR